MLQEKKVYQEKIQQIALKEDPMHKRISAKQRTKKNEYKKSEKCIMTK